MDIWHLLPLPYAQSVTLSKHVTFFTERNYDVTQFIFNITMKSTTSVMQWFDYSFHDLFFFLIGVAAKLMVR